MFIFVLLFSIGVFLVFYAYVLFPFILKLIAKGKTQSISEPFTAPVSILISVFNEEVIIGQKVRSILDSTVNHSHLEILIGSDGSTDRTNEIVKSFANEFPFIKLFAFAERRGKPAVINELVSLASHSLIILTDANVIFGKDVVAKLVNHFSDSRVGLVGANILNIGMQRDGISIQEKSYIERENLIKYREGLIWGTMMGPFGGCYALRKDLYHPVPVDFLVDDFFISMKIIQSGYRCINDLNVLCYEDVSNDLHQEYRRKARISAGNYQNLMAFGGTLLRPFTPAGFCFVSHKFLRWITPFFIILTLASLMVLWNESNVYKFLLVGEVLLILSPLIDWLARKAGIHVRLLRFIAYFSYMNLALLNGFFRYISGIRSGIWNPTKRVTVVENNR